MARDSFFLYANGMISLVFKAKHWQIFGIFFLLGFIELLIKEINPAASQMTYIIMLSLNFGWLLLLGYGLAKRLKTLDSFAFKAFAIAVMLLVVSSTAFRILSATYIMDSIFLKIFCAVYSLILVIIICTYQASALKRLETKEEVEINDYFGEILLFMFWPIGVWRIQPRINRLE